MAKHATLHSSLKYDVAKLMRIIRDAKKLNKTEVAWGWINGKAYKAGDINGRKGVPYALVAIRNEFGGYTKNAKTGKFVYIPSRAYFQQSTRDSIKSTGDSSLDVVNTLLRGGEVREKLKEIGEDQVKIVKKSVDRNNMTPLHKKTIAIKGTSKQWYDTGELMRNLTSKVTYKRAGYRGG